MTRTQGIVKSVRIDQEAGKTVLRLVLEDGDVRIPVEMRGHQIKGIVEVGDEVTIEGAEGRDPDGVLRPKEVVNDSTQSTVTAEKRGFKAGFSRVFVSLGLSIASGLGSTVVARVLVPREPVPRGLGNAVPEAAFSAATVVPVLIGVVVGLLVFYFAYIRPRRRSG